MGVACETNGRKNNSFMVEASHATAHRMARPTRMGAARLRPYSFSHGTQSPVTNCY
jgi:hypothetical protein